jgi:hypothetical protein
VGNQNFAGAFACIVVTAPSSKKSLFWALLGPKHAVPHHVGGMEPASDTDNSFRCFVRLRQSVCPSRAGRAESVPMAFCHNTHISGAQLKHRPLGGEWLKAGV